MDAHRQYSYRLYWEDVGPGLFADLLQRDRPWTDLFDASAAPQDRGACPEELAIACLVPDALRSPAPDESAERFLIEGVGRRVPATL